MSDVVVGLDIGTSRIRVIIGEISETGVFQITGVGTSPSTGLRKGVVVNIENTVKAISQAVEAAEMMAGVDVTHCMIGIGGSHIDGLNSRGIVAVSGKGRDNREIGQEDIHRVIDAAKAVVIPMDRQVIHVIPQSYIVDEQKGIKDPKNMIGIRLEAEIHIITGSVTSIQNEVKCVNRASLAVDEYIYHALAAVKAVMTEDEKDLGSILIDIGGGTTDVIVMVGGAPILTFVIPLGGIQVTNDLSIVKGISSETAEKIKIDAGCCWDPLIEENESVILPGIGGRPPIEIPRLEVCEIIQPRMTEIFIMIKEKLMSLPKAQNFSGNIVLTGGGSLLPGVVELASEVFDTQSVRLGIPNSFGTLLGEYRSPDYATVIGLVLSAYERYKLVLAEEPSSGIVSTSFGDRLKGWFKEFF